LSEEVESCTKVIPPLRLIAAALTALQHKISLICAKSIRMARDRNPFGETTRVAPPVLGSRSSRFAGGRALAVVYTKRSPAA